MIKLQPFKVVRLRTFFSSRSDYAEASRISSGHYRQGYFMGRDDCWYIRHSVRTSSANPSRTAFYRINRWVKR